MLSRDITSHVSESRHGAPIDIGLTELKTDMGHPPITVNAANQVNGMTYDAAGNVTVDNYGNRMSYDAEGRVVTASGYSYIYDGDGQRVMKSGGPNAKMFWPGAGSDQLNEFDLSGNVLFGNVTLAGRLVARRDASGNIHYFFRDHLGSERISVNASGTVEDNIDYYPWGAGAPPTSYTTNTPYTFDSYLYDSETSTYHTDFRQQSFSLGRWLRPDPYDGSYDPSNPQSFNRYSYVLNNPVSLIDPNGLDDCPPVVAIAGGGVTAKDFTDGCLIYGGGGGGSVLPPPAPPESDPCANADSCIQVWSGPTIPPPLAGGVEGGMGSLGVGSPGGIAPNNPTQPTACQIKTLNAINNQFGTNLTAANILPTSDPNPTAGGGQINTNFGVVSGLSPGQFNAIQAGRFAPSGVFGFLTGYGSSLHVVAGPSGLDPSANLFGASNIGGMYSAGFTAHFDSAWAYNPFGALLHYLIDVRGHGAHRQPCP